jgi:3-deoxy-7-phosphoheptulonate synthase
MHLDHEAAGADGLMIEMHPTPEIALSDGAQSLNPKQFDKVAARIQEFVAWFGKQMG